MAEATGSLSALSGNDGMPLLQRGSKAVEDIKAWQTFLNQQGVMVDGKPVAVDGVFGRRTFEATKALQKTLSVRVDGKVGKRTLAAALTLAQSAPSEPLPSVAPMADSPEARPSLRPDVSRETSSPADIPMMGQARGPGHVAPPNQFADLKPATWTTAQSMGMAMNPMTGPAAAGAAQPMPEGPPMLGMATPPSPDIPPVMPASWSGGPAGEQNLAMNPLAIQAPPPETPNIPVMPPANGPPPTSPFVMGGAGMATGGPTPPLGSPAQQMPPEAAAVVDTVSKMDVMLRHRIIQQLLSLEAGQ